MIHNLSTTKHYTEYGVRCTEYLIMTSDPLPLHY